MICFLVNHTHPCSLHTQYHGYCCPDNVMFIQNIHSVSTPKMRIYFCHYMIIICIDIVVLCWKLQAHSSHVLHFDMKTENKIKNRKRNNNMRLTLSQKRQRKCFFGIWPIAANNTIRRYRTGSSLAQGTACWVAAIAWNLYKNSDNLDSMTKIYISLAYATFCSRIYDYHNLVIFSSNN